MTRASRASTLALIVTTTLGTLGCGRVGFESHEPLSDAGPGVADSGMPDAGAPVDAGPRDGGPDAGLVCGPTQWIDFAAATCRECPATPLTCASLDTATATTFFDPPSGIFHISMLTGLAQVTRGTLTLMITDGTGAHPQAITVTAAGNILIANTAMLLRDPSITALSIASLQLTDKCGAVVTITNFAAAFTVGGGTVAVTDFFCSGSA